MKETCSKEFAQQELKRLQDHCYEIHGMDFCSLENECLENFTMADYIMYTSIYIEDKTDDQSKRLKYLTEQLIKEYGD